MATPELHESFWQLGFGQLSSYELDLDTQWTGRQPGDVDILGGPLLWANPSEFATALSATQRQLPTAHPQSPRVVRRSVAGRTKRHRLAAHVQYLAAIEVRCSYFETGLHPVCELVPQKTDDFDIR